MKKIYFLSLSLVMLSAFSCSSDDSSTEKEVIVIQQNKEWVPQKVELVSSLFPYSFDYPHAEGCDKDYIKLMENSAAKLYEHADTTCAVTESSQIWNRNGNQISFSLMGNQVSGTVVLENENQLVIESQVSQYSAYIQEFYPEYAQYLPMLGNANAKLTLNKR